MKAVFHRQITTSALQSFFSPRALEIIVRANLGQDGCKGLLFHPEFHFDDSRFEDGKSYLAQQSNQAYAALREGNRLLAWQAFGRKTHAVQDFYAHSNYVQLFVELYLNALSVGIDPLVPEILNDPRLYSGHVHWGWEIIQHLLPNLAARLQDRIPANTHAGMNLDDPGRGPLFALALQAAIQRTASEFLEFLKPLDSPSRQRFCDGFD